MYICMYIYTSICIYIYIYMYIMYIDALNIIVYIGVFITQRMGSICDADIVHIHVYVYIYM
jgi:hypothetical protein